MKAREYAKMYNESKTDKTLGEIIRMFDREMRDLIRQRGCKKDSAVVGVFEEMDRKWQSFAKQTTGVGSDGFRIMMEGCHLKAYTSWNLSRLRLHSRLVHVRGGQQ